MHIKLTRITVPTWPVPSPLSDIVVQLSMLTLTALVAIANMYFLYVSKDAEQFPSDVLFLSL